MTTKEQFIEMAKGICDSAIVNGIVRGYATVAEKANVKEGTLVEGDTYYIQS